MTELVNPWRLVYALVAKHGPLELTASEQLAIPPNPKLAFEVTQTGKVTVERVIADVSSPASDAGKSEPTSPTFKLVVATLDNVLEFPKGDG